MHWFSVCANHSAEASGQVRKYRRRNEMHEVAAADDRRVLNIIRLITAESCSLRSAALKDEIAKSTTTSMLCDRRFIAMSFVKFFTQFEQFRAAW